MWGPLTKYVEPETLDHPLEKETISFHHRGPSDPYVIFYRRNKPGGVSLHVPHWSGYGEWPDHINHFLMPKVGFLEVGANSERVWGVHIWETSLEATILRFQALFAWGRERTQKLGPQEGYDRLEKSLDFDVIETDCITSCDEHWLVQCLKLPVPEDNALTSSPASLFVAGEPALKEGTG